MKLLTTGKAILGWNHCFFKLFLQFHYILMAVCDTMLQ
ncbi:hypothetical protein SanJ4206_0162c [Streptococcus anginosus]|nr:hypothetical protein SanJ4206_0162c [Streptococcus anginosus]